jgi:dipeptidyl aminopeptidase/acylaminoacyl peptidase
VVPTKDSEVVLTHILIHFPSSSSLELAQVVPDLSPYLWFIEKGSICKGQDSTSLSLYDLPSTKMKQMNKILLPAFSFFFLILGITAHAQENPLSVESIMRNPQWMGSFPSQIRWDEHGERIYFNYNRDQDPEDSLYYIDIKSKQLEKVSWEEERKLVSFQGVYNADHTIKVYIKNNHLVLYHIKDRSEKNLLTLEGRISHLDFLGNTNVLAFRNGNNVYALDLDNGNLRKLTDIRSGEKPSEKKASEQETWLKEDNLDLLQVVREREEKKDSTRSMNQLKEGGEKYSFYLGKRQLSNISVSANGEFLGLVFNTPAQSSSTKVPDYIAASGYTSDLNARPKVGTETGKSELALYHLAKDTLYFVSIEQLPGIKDLPDYVQDYRDQEWEEKVREVVFSPLIFSHDGKQAITTIRSKDNKDRWIALIQLETGELEVLDRQRDEAWIAGPGIGWASGGGSIGWLPDNRHIYFQSEESGYSHLYLFNVIERQKTALTEGKFEVFDPFISKDKKYWYLTTSEVHPGERHFYRMPLLGGQMEQLTSMVGNNEVVLSPDEKWLAIRHSYSNQPWELYLQPNKTKAATVALTSGQSDEFKAYAWRDPQLVEFQAGDDAAVPARLYLPKEEVKNGAAVIFVHGAGYLQNVHKWWSSYFREYMFHNLLTDLGYTVLDIDYRGSAGYGRDWRTGIYRHMGGKDLSDQVDGAKYLVAQHGIDQERIGIYGGSYGGFITLMALFNEGDTFKSGAALRSVTDWAHYNHPYTANILNEPSRDPIAYRRSSPIYFAEGFKGNLLIAHGMVDVNVHFQDVVRLSQRLIELGKDNWELAVYPAEDHGFVEPSSWTDEYKRILKLFNQTLLK